MVKPNPQTQPQAFVGTLIGGAVLKKVIDVALDKALDKVVRSPSLPVSERDVAPIKEVVRNEVLKEVGPVWENETNQEPLWRSKVMWTSVGTVIASAAGIYSMITGDNRAVELVAMGATAVTGIGTIISRLSASKALGR